MSDLPNPADLDYDPAPAPGDEGPPVQTTLADLPSQLKEWLGSVSGRMTGWAQDAATLVNDFITRRDIADNATAEAARFTENIRAFSGGLDQVVRADPTATNMALGLAALTVPAIIADHPHLPDEGRAGIADQLAGEVGRNIARSAVLAWAQRDPDTAHAEMARLGALIPEGERGALADHVDLLGRALQQDREGAAAQTQADQASRGYATTLAYLDQLVDANGNPRIPRDFVRRVVNDQNVSPADTALLQRVQERIQKLQTQYAGLPPPLTDGAKVKQFIDAAQGGREGQRKLLDHIGIDLDLKDAQTLIAASRNPAEADYLRNVMRLAERALKGPDGELGRDGSEAMGRFAQTFLREYRTLGRGALDPNSPNFLGALRGFAGRDEMEQRLATEQKAARLADIFARKQAATRAQAANQQAIARTRADLSDVRADQAEFERQSEREERARERTARLEARAIQQQSHAEAVAAQTAARLEAQRSARYQGIADQALAAGRRLGGGGGGGRREAVSNPAETFRRFAGLGRPGVG